MANVTYTFLEKFLWNFYIVDMDKTTFEKLEDVPNLVNEMIPIFFSMIFVEHIINKLLGKGGTKLGDGITSISLGLVMETVKLVTRGFELYGYHWLYRHRLIDLDWQNPWTWWFAAIGIDFGYYWAHRTSHEINLFWSGHQVHHSSEEYNLTTALRQSAFQRLFSFGIYQPLAMLGVPLPAAMIHFQFNLFVQYWIHTDLLGNLGPLEWILNTASHHRVHHGTNKWCLDKNYAGWLIIWDKMFGTFEPERKGEPIVYGLVTQPQTFEPLSLQLFYFKNVFKKALSMCTWQEVFKALFYGPGWQPGTPRLGDPNQLPDKTLPRKKYIPVLPLWTEVYVCSHFIICLAIAQSLQMKFYSFNWITAMGAIGFVFLSAFTIGSFYDGHIWAPAFEAFRCVATVAVMKQGSIASFSSLGHPTVDSIILAYFALSALFWCSQTLALIDVKKIITDEKHIISKKKIN